MRRDEQQAPDRSPRPAAAASDDTSPKRGEPFVLVPLRYRQEHATWSNAEVAAHLELLMVSYQIGGTFETIDLARAYLKGRSGALDGLVGRDAFVELASGGWQLADYVELYDERKRIRPYLPNAVRVADARAKRDRGEPWTEAERKAVQRSRPGSEPDGDPEADREGHRPDTSGHVPLTPILPRLESLYDAFTQLTDLPCTPHDRNRIDGLCREHERDLVRRAFYADADPRRNPDRFLGRVFHALTEGVVAA